MFERWLEINTKKSGLIIGPRRCGKTTLLKKRFPEYNYITLDNLDYLNWAGRDAKGLIDQLGPKSIIDEIQRKPD
jgi:predicted AAA+ superfamily ATPase